jgi:glycerate dehydrogenase
MSPTKKTSKLSKPAIVFLDEGTVDLGDLDMTTITKQGDYRAHRNTSINDIMARSAEADIIITNKCVFGKKELSKLPKLKLICAAATGVNNIDLETAKQHNVAVTNVAGYSTTTVAEHTLMFILAFSHRLINHHSSATSGQWSRSPFFTMLDYPYSDLSGKTLGIIGFGNIGKQVAKLAKAFGMKLLIARLPDSRYPATPKRIPLQEVFSQSDFLTLHCHLSEKTKHLIHRATLNTMKRQACLINLARGPIVREEDVAEALLQGKLAGYATDVMSQEPPPAHNPFFRKELKGKVLVTPHVAWASYESRQHLANEIGKNIAAFKKGQSRNRVDLL